jgi:oligoendopeptidase F
MSESVIEKKLPARRDVPVGDTWDLASLFSSDAEGEAALAEWEKMIPGFEAFAGKLAKSPEQLAACLAHDVAVDRAGDRLGTYAHLRASEDQGAAESQRMVGRFQHVATRAGEKASFIRPEILAIPPATLTSWLELPVLADYRLLLERLVRTRPHVLSQPEEKILAKPGPFAGTA